MKIGIVGYQGSGKSTLFHWLTGVEPDPSLAHATQHAMASVPDSRIEQLCGIYQPKKVTTASLEIVDCPGLSRSHEGSAARLGMIREAGCLLVVAAAFGGADPIADLNNFEDDLLIADLDIVGGRIARLRESIKKPRPNRQEQEEELAALEPLLAALEGGQALRDMELTAPQQKAIRSFQLFSEKPRLTILNLADDEQAAGLLAKLPEDADAVAIALSLQLELTEIPEEEREEFCREMEVQAYDRDQLLRTIMDTSGQMLFFTAGEKEVRSWMLRRGAPAVEAAGNIHTDMARGFIRAETMSCDDLVRLGSEREVKAQNLMRHEPKDYIVQDGDVINMRFNV